MKQRLQFAAFGIIATLVGMAMGEVVASLLQPDTSPVSAVSSSVIDLTPHALKDWAIVHFGNNDKLVLLGNVVVAVLILAAIAGLLAKKRLEYGLALLVALVLVAGAAVVSRPAFAFFDLVPTFFTLVTGVVALTWLVRLKKSAASAPAHTLAETSTVAQATPATPAATSVETTEAPEPTHAGKPTLHLGADRPIETTSGGPVRQTWESVSTKPTRRGVVIAMSVLAAGAALLGTAGRVIINVRSRAEDIALPTPTNDLPPIPEGVTVNVSSEVTPLQISNANFYRVDTRPPGDTPIVSSDGWTLTVDGDVENELEISFDDLLKMPMVERDITMTCVSNSVGGNYVGGARWQGVMLKDIFDMAGVGDSADQLVGTDFDGMTIGTPLDLVRDGRDAMLVVGMNGEPLPREHGFPARIVIPGLYGFISATKWVTKLTLTTYADTEVYWTKKKWEPIAPIKPSARIDTPKSLSQVKTGKNTIGGVAWAQNTGGVAKVQVQVDGAAWRDAELGPDVGNVYWRQWYLNANLKKSGQHSIKARVVDGDGMTQTDVRADPFPSGSSGIHSIFVTAS